MFVKVVLLLENENLNNLNKFNDDLFNFRVVDESKDDI